MKKMRELTKIYKERDRNADGTMVKEDEENVHDKIINQNSTVPIDTDPNNNPVDRNLPDRLIVHSDEYPVSPDLCCRAS